LRGESYAEPFTKGDTIGCGLYYVKQEIFFTKNGKYLGVAFKKVPNGTFYPVVGLHSTGELIVANFGQKPFKFDLSSMISELKEKMMVEVRGLQIQPGDVQSIIRSFLFYYGYEETLKSFEQICGNINEESTITTLQNRKKIRKFILSGDIPASIATINELYPNELNNFRRACFLLNCQYFIELIRQDKVGEAIDYAQKILSPFKAIESWEESYLQEVLGLLAYTNPYQSSVSHLLGVQQREVVADAVNEFVLVLEKQHPSQSTLETLMRQLATTQNTLREENGDRGEIFHLSNYV